MWIVAVVIIILAAAILLFPWRLRIDFDGSLELICTELHFFRYHKTFKKKLYFFKKEEKVDDVAHESNTEESKPSEPLKETKKSAPQKRENLSEPLKKNKSEKSQENDNAFEEQSLDSLEETKELKKEFSERDFFTILLQPRMVSKIWKACVDSLGRVLKIFKVKFENSYIAGFRGRQPAETGMLAAIAAGIPSVFPQLQGWTVHWDWCGYTPFQIKGHCIAKVNLYRILCALIVAGSHALKIFVLYRILKRQYLKSPEEMPLSWWRTKILNFLSEE